MNICFVVPGPIEWASSRLRGYWVADALSKRWYNVAVVAPGEASKIIHDVYIWVKQIDLNFVKANQDKRHYWDLCDPMHWFSPEVEAYIPWIDGVVCSTQALANDFKKWAEIETMPVVCIPDRLDMRHYPKPRVDVKKHGVTRFIWYGIAANRQALYSTLANLERLKANGRSIELTIYDDRPDIQFTGVSFPVYHSCWNLDMETAVISSHDIALLPPYPGAWGKVKSNNKKLTAWACGVPVTDGQDYNELLNIVDNENARKLNVTDNMTCYNDLMIIENSAKEWEAILC